MEETQWTDSEQYLWISIKEFFRYRSNVNKWKDYRRQSHT